MTTLTKRLDQLDEKTAKYRESFDIDDLTTHERICFEQELLLQKYRIEDKEAGVTDGLDSEKEELQEQGSNVK